MAVLLGNGDGTFQASQTLAAGLFPIAVAVGNFDGSGDSEGISYSYDQNGNRLSMTDPTGTTTYTYDKLNRLTSLTNPFDQTIGLDYDALIWQRYRSSKEIKPMTTTTEGTVSRQLEQASWLAIGQSHTRHLYRKNTLVMSFREAQRREIFGYKASLDPTEKISRSYRRSK